MVWASPDPVPARAIRQHRVGKKRLIGPVMELFPAEMKVSLIRNRTKSLTQLIGQRIGFVNIFESRANGPGMNTNGSRLTLAVEKIAG